MKDGLSVAFLWHMHQPMYKDLITGRYYLPWVRLHATHSYLDMIRILDDHPDIRCTFNLSGSLIYQLLDIGGPGEVDDIYLGLSAKKSADLTEEDRIFILKNFFSSHPFGFTSLDRYKDLRDRRGEDVSDDAIAAVLPDFDISDIRDIQVFFNLSWCGYTLREEDALVKGLINKGEGFSEEEKIELLSLQKRTVSSILPLYKERQDAGKIEISTTPFYHPILPLLLEKGGGYRRDAAQHVKKAVSLYRDVFGRPPKGMWPAEGSVSDDTVRLMAKNGIRWTASDEGVLLESFKNSSFRREELVFDPFMAGKWPNNISMVFRDIGLSNAVSFEYAHIPGDVSAGKLMEDLTSMRDWLGDKAGDHIVSIILDGENPWSYYYDGGKDFLDSVYGRLASTPGIRTVRIGEYLEKASPKRRLGKIAPGSWINHDFRKWSGSDQKDRAWEYLQRTRKDIFSSGRVPKEVLEELYIAESSDWFWWYDEFGTELNFIFDDLFRMHLKNAYRLSARDVPEYLNDPICDTSAVMDTTAGEMAR